MAIGAVTKWYAGATAATVAVLGAGWFALVSPQKANADDIATQTASVDATNRATQGQIATLKLQYAQLPQLSSQVALIRTHIPQQPDEPTLIRTVTRNASNAGVSLTSMQVQAPAVLGTGASAVAAGTNPFQAPGQISQISMNLNIVGTFAHTRLFLDSLENMQRVILVTGVNISRATTPDGKPTLQTVISGRVFIANPGSPIVPAGSPAAGSPAVSTTSSTTTPS